MQRIGARKRVIASAFAIAVAIAGCGNASKALPADCAGGARWVRAAVERQQKLSRCMVRAASTADVETMGGAFVVVADELAQQARRRPNGPAAFRLGYLVAAVRRGASRTQGIYSETAHRVESAAAGVDSAAFRRGLRAGSAAG